MDPSEDRPQPHSQAPGLFTQFLRPSASRQPSHAASRISHHSTTNVWSSQYQREANDEQVRRTHAATALHEAVKKSDLGTLQSLLSEDGVDPDSRDEKGRTALHAAAKFGRVEPLCLLLERKDVDIDALDQRKETPLHLAAMYSHRECVEMLLRAGANTEIADERGHLPRYYASTEAVTRLFDNPPKVGRRRKASKLSGDDAENRMYSGEEVLYLATAASPPQGMPRTLCESFRGSFWEPDSDMKWSSASVDDLVYGQSETATKRRAAGSKWFHLSATSEVWAKDLARNICAARGYSSDRSRAMRDFMSRVFRGVDAEGPVRKHHFVRETISEKKLGEDEMYAVVLPIIDVDKRDYVQLARNHRTQALDQARESGSLTFNALDTAPFDPVLGMHLTRMLQLSSFLDQSLPRSLDQSYHEYLDDVKIGMLDSDQVMTRYIGRLKSKGVEVVKRPSEKRFSIFGTTSSDSLARPARQSADLQGGNMPAENHAKERSSPPLGSADGIADSEGGDMRHDGHEQPEPDDFITVPHFWLFKLDADTIITLYPERWDKTNEARLHDHVLNSVSSNRDIQDNPENFSMNAVAETILKSCLSFEAKAFAKCINPNVPSDSHDVEVAFSKAYSNSIAEIYTEATERFDALKNGLGSLSKDPNAFYRDVKEETKILIRIDDNIGEIRMIKRILLNQASTFDIFQRAVYGNPSLHDGAGTFAVGCGYQRANIDTFDQLETEAERVRAMAVTLLDLRQREASIEDALSMGEQSTMLFIFTTVTVLFAPLSFVCGLLAMPVAGLPDSWSASPLAEVFGLATLGTMGLCLLMWALYKIYQAIEIAHRSKERRPRPPPPPPSLAAVPQTDADATAGIWGLRGPWKPGGGGGLRFRRSRVKQYDEAVKDLKVGNSMDGLRGSRFGGGVRGDVEKGVVGLS